MSVLNARIIRDSSDIDLAITGAVEEGEDLREVILRPADFRDSPIAVKLTALFYSIQDGVTLLLYWEGEDDHTLMMPIAGRGILDLGRFGGLENPRVPGFTGNVLLVAERHSPGKKHFSLSFEFSKQRT